MEQNNTEDDKPIYMIAEAEKGDRDYYGDFNYGFCPLAKYACESKMTETKKLDGSPHGYCCAGYAVVLDVMVSLVDFWYTASHLAFLPLKS